MLQLFHLQAAGSCAYVTLAIEAGPKLIGCWRTVPTGSLCWQRYCSMASQHIGGPHIMAVGCAVRATLA